MAEAWKQAGRGQELRDQSVAAGQRQWDPVEDVNLEEEYDLKNNEKYFSKTSKIIYWIFIVIFLCLSIGLAIVSFALVRAV